ncbi:Methylated-DNA-[protein]-cysteine S-methyltransferase, DNA binding protein [Ophiocordyceps sinensis CO18]|uniref:Methylated-DNA-[protein]-cysteine S-methyltransferase, DNA binding protein n=1 Tax=Ophiocordyceps sinensis (strain Co18 / CGMCC 3.14243) TaxID=911162 RepID=T5AJ52_OPHSC|nr:Methylated-DNA-[protein]-cysteine S-methyltransferase, DNA binding protein [Ophiocordyceps sinensis CO18]
MPRSDEAEAFFHAVYAAVQEIPHARVSSYGHIAMLVGTRKPHPPSATLAESKDVSLKSPAPSPGRPLHEAPLVGPGRPLQHPQRAVAARRQRKGPHLAQVPARGRPEPGRRLARRGRRRRHGSPGRAHGPSRRVRLVSQSTPVAGDAS